MANNNQQHGGPVKNMLAKIGGVVTMIVGPLTAIHGLLTLPSNALLGVSRIIGGTLAVVFGKAYFDAGRDATTLAKIQGQGAGPDTPSVPQQMGMHQSPDPQAEMAYRNDFAARETERAGNRAEQGAARGAG